MTPISSARNVEVGTTAGIDGLGNDVMIEPDMQSRKHGLTTAQESTDVDGVTTDEAWVDPPLSMSIESVNNPEVDPQRTPESERNMSPKTHCSTLHDTLTQLGCWGHGSGRRILPKGSRVPKWHVLAMTLVREA